MVKIALDPTPFHWTYKLLDFPALARDLGYKYLQMTPHADFIPFFNHPKADDDLVKKLKKAASDAAAYVRSLALPSVIVPDRAVDAQSLVAFADLVVSAGGTINREAAALGVPVEWHMSYGIGHGIDQDGLRHGGEFLARRLAATR